MVLRIRNGRYHYRFEVSGREYSGSTRLAATKRNANKARQFEAKVREKVEAGQAWQLKVQAIPFTDAASQYLTFAEGEYHAHRNTYKRIRGSFSSLTEFFGSRPVHLITGGDIEDYKSLRRRTKDSGGHGVRDVTLRHDLHALSGFFRYSIGHRWARESPLVQIDIPSDKDAVRMYILNEVEEQIYFRTCLEMDSKCNDACHPAVGRADRKRYQPTAKYRDLYDLCRLVRLQGCRPDEIRQLTWACVHLDDVAPAIQIAEGKTPAARRKLRLTPESITILDRRKALSAQRSHLVFPSPVVPSQPVSMSQIESAHNRVIEEIQRNGVALPIVIYDLRHTCATRLAERGTPLTALAAILGHTGIRMVTKYVHPTQEEQDRVMVVHGGAAPVLAGSSRTETGPKPV